MSTTTVAIRPSPTRATDSATHPLSRFAAMMGKVVPTELDGRGGTPPKRIPAILAALQAIPPGALQYYRTNERPTELLRDLERHGVESGTLQLPDGTWRTRLQLRR